MNWLKCPKCEQKSCEVNISIDNCSAYCHRCGWSWDNSTNDHWIEILTPSEYAEIFGCDSGEIHNKIDKNIINLFRNGLNGKSLLDFGLLTKGLVEQGLDKWCLKSLENESVSSKLSNNWYNFIKTSSVKLDKYEYVGNCDSIFDNDGDCIFPIFKDIDDFYEVKNNGNIISVSEFFNLVGKDPYINELLGNFNDYNFIYNKDRNILIALNKITDINYVFCKNGKCIAKKNKDIKIGFDLINMKFKFLKG